MSALLLAFALSIAPTAHHAKHVVHHHKHKTTSTHHVPRVKQAPLFVL